MASSIQSNVSTAVCANEFGIDLPRTSDVEVRSKIRLARPPTVTQLQPILKATLQTQNNDSDLAREGCVLTGPWLDASEQEALFQYLLAQSHWEARYNNFSGVSVQQPRLGYTVGLAYAFSGGVHAEHPEMPTAVREIVRRVMDGMEICVGHPLNNALVQLYRDGQDCIYPHSDDESRIMKTTPDQEVFSVAILSLGAPRTMDFKVGGKTPGKLRCNVVAGDHVETCGPSGAVEFVAEPSARVASLRLQPGHLTVFAGDQSLMTHGIKRVKGSALQQRPEENLPRISISARWFREE